MPLTPSQRPTREWPLLLVTLALVGIIVYPLWTTYAEDGPGAKVKAIDEKIKTLEQESRDLEGNKQKAARQGEVETELQSLKADRLAYRLGKLFLGPEQVACYCCFVWGLFIFTGRYWEMRRQRGAIRFGLLSTEEGTRILPEDARQLQRHVDQVTAQRGPFILANMIRAGLAKLALSRSSLDVRETLKTQAEVDLGRLISSMATMNYLAWAIPAIGFLGTVRGLAGSMTLAGQGGEQLRIATQHLTIAFDCTLVALALSLVSMFLIHTLQREEESVVIDCQQYCLEHLVNRIYEPEAALNGHSPSMEVAGNGMVSRSVR